MPDIHFSLGDHKFNLRVGAVIRRGDAVLLLNLPGQTWCYTPGGRIATGESSREALARELQEELGRPCPIGRPLLGGENFFTFRDCPIHEVCFYYEAELPGEAPATTKDGEIVRWVLLAEFGALDLKPPFLKEHILRPRAETTWVIHRD
jgi:8-oxo-dGTP pyrophosphatase MutT (NUDIX family)